MAGRGRGAALLGCFAAVLVSSIGILPTKAASAGTAGSGLAWPGVGQFIGLTPARLLDATVGAGATIDLRVTGRGGVPSANVAAVALNVTVLSATATSFLTMFPKGVARPNAAAMMFPVGTTTRNLTITKVGAGGVVSLFNAHGRTRVLADVVGYYTNSSGFVAITSARLLDTRPTGTTIDGLFRRQGRIGAHQTVAFSAAARGGIPLSGIAAVAVNITVGTPTAAGTVSAYAEASPAATTTMTFNTGQTRSSLAMVRRGLAGEIVLVNNSNGSVDFIADAVGYYPTGGGHHPTSPVRILDTRPAGATVDARTQRQGPLTEGHTLTIQLSGRAGLPQNTVGTIALTIDAINPTTSGSLIAYPTGGPRPTIALLSWNAHQNSSNLTLTRVNAAGQLTLYLPTGATNLIADITAYYPKAPPGGTIETIAGGIASGPTPATLISLDGDYFSSLAADTHRVYTCDLISALGWGPVLRAVDLVTGDQSVVAGNGGRGYGGDGGPATAATLAACRPAVAPNGDIYIADGPNNRVRRVDHTTGIITTIAGTGVSGYNGDNQLATHAQLAGPSSLAIDGVGNVYILDAENDRIRKIDHITHIITTIAGTGTSGYNGDDQPATRAEISEYGAIVSDSVGDVYIDDGSRIRRIDHITGIISTVAGTGASGNSGDGGPAVNAAIGGAYGIAREANGAIDIGEFDGYHSVIRRFVEGGDISTIAGGGAASPGVPGAAVDAQLDFVTSLTARAGGGYYFAEPGVVVQADPAGALSLVAGTFSTGPLGDGTNATTAEFSPFRLGRAPEGGEAPLQSSLTFRPTGEVLLATQGVLRQVDRNSLLSTLGGLGSGEDGGLASDASFYVNDVTVGPTGDIYLLDDVNRLRKIDHTTGIISTIAGNGTAITSGDGGLATNAGIEAYALAVDGQSNVYLLTNYHVYGETQVGFVRRIDHATGVITTVAGIGQVGYSGDFGPATQAELDYPTDIAIDQNGNLLIAEANRIRKVDHVTGIITTIAGNGGTGFSGDGGPATHAQIAPVALAVGPTGTIYFTDTNSRRIRAIGTTGLISTIAGNGGTGSTGDGGSAIDAQLGQTVDIAVDGAGDVCVNSVQAIRCIALK